MTFTKTRTINVWSCKSLEGTIFLRPHIYCLESFLIQYLAVILGKSVWTKSETQTIAGWPTTESVNFLVQHHLHLLAHLVRMPDNHSQHCSRGGHCWWKPCCCKWPKAPIEWGGVKDLRQWNCRRPGERKHTRISPGALPSKILNKPTEVNEKLNVSNKGYEVTSWAKSPRHKECPAFLLPWSSFCTSN